MGLHPKKDTHAIRTSSRRSHASRRLHGRRGRERLHGGASRNGPARGCLVHHHASRVQGCLTVGRDRCMNLEAIRAENARKRALAHSLYRENAGLDTLTYPNSIKPPEWMCRKHADLWCKWTDHKPFTPLMEMSLTQP